MLDDNIREARERLNESIITGKDYEEIYKLSVELDELIAEYYIGNGNKTEKQKKYYKNSKKSKKQIFERKI